MLRKLSAPLVEVFVAAPPERCFAIFCDARDLPRWVPGLRRARIVRSRPDGLPLEVVFEFGKTLTYSIVYDYDLAARRVTWQPGLGRRDAVSGWAEFVPEGAGCRMRYSVAPTGDEREAQAANADRLVAAFVRWVTLKS
jgi:hypothetical protein